MKRTLAALALTVLALSWGAPIALAADGSWSGEVIDIACYQKDKNNVGAKHAACATKCVKEGNPMGLLVGTEVVTLKAGADAKAYESMKDMAGKTVEVKGSVEEKDGKKTVTVASATAK